MTSLEKLTLFLSIDCQRVFIDPKSLIDTFSTCSPRLHSFSFYLSTRNKKDDLSHYSFNYRTQPMLINGRCQEVLHMISTSPIAEIYQMFTLPFEFNKLYSISRPFPNIVFEHVVELWMCNVVPLDHDFLLRIAQAFPLLTRLFVDDLFSVLHPIDMPDNNPSDKTAEYPHLTFLDIFRANTVTVEQFLNEKTTRMPRLAYLSVLYDLLNIVTQDFTREETRRNCANVAKLVTYRVMVGSEDYYNYFPSLWIDFCVMLFTYHARINNRFDWHSRWRKRMFFAEYLFVTKERNKKERRIKRKKQKRKENEKKNENERRMKRKNENERRKRKKKKVENGYWFSLSLSWITWAEEKYTRGITGKQVFLPNSFSAASVAM